MNSFHFSKPFQKKWILFISLSHFKRNEFFSFLYLLNKVLHLFTFQTPILVPIKYIIHFIIYFKIQEC
jgi:uncharacterized membrane protein